MWQGGFDYYWGSWNFASAEVIRDPRGDELWVFPMRARFADEDNDWVQFTLAPATQRTIGWAVDMKVRWLRFGIEQNSRYDFTTRDNIVFTWARRWSLPKPKEVARSAEFAATIPPARPARRERFGPGPPSAGAARGFTERALAALAHPVPDRAGGGDGRVPAGPAPGRDSLRSTFPRSHPGGPRCLPIAH
jgi:hypothetical protein